MNSNILIVGLVAVAAGLGLLLLLGPAEPVVVPEGGDVAVVTQVVEEAAEASEVVSTTFYHAADGATSSAVSVVKPVSYAPPCGSCGTVHAVPVFVAPVVGREVRLAGGCGSPVTPCDKPDCTVCRRVPAPCGRPSCATCSKTVTTCGRTGTLCGRPDCSTCVRSAPSCGRPVTECRVPACSQPEPCHLDCSRGCERTCPTACPERLGINHNLPTCFDECSMVQLHSTVRQPLCSAYRFEWAASKGSFLNPDASDPLYFTPTVYMPGGEEVLITLTITDPAGIRYTDEIRVLVRNSR